MAYTFIISDESVNSNGFRIQTKGIRTERFRNNPIMFHMHEREKGIIGRWDNIRIEGVKLLADAVFDENNPLGKEVKDKVDSGFVRSASIGVTINKYEQIKGVETVTDCELMEVSIVDIPSNQNAVKLFNKKGVVILSLKELEVKDLRARLVEILKLPATASDDQIVDAVGALANAESPEAEADKALQLGYIEPSQLVMLKCLARTDNTAFRQFMQDKEKASSVQINKEIQRAVSKGKIITFERGIFENIGRQLGHKALADVLAVMPEKTEFTPLVRKITNDRNPSWGLKEYRKYAPQELNDNPELYAELLKKETGKEVEYHRSLAYYRKHDPEYLAQHPEIYAELIAKERNK